MPYASSTFNPNDGTYSFYPDDGGDPFIAAGQAAAAKHAELNPVDPYRISGKEDGYRIAGHPGLIDNYSRTQDALDDWKKDQDAYRRPASLDEPAGKHLPMQPSAELTAATRRGEDARTADLSPAAAAQLARNDAAGGGLSDAWDYVKGAAHKVGENMNKTRAREAAKGNFSGIDATDRAAFEDAKAQGLVPDTSTPGEAAGGKPAGIVLGDQDITADVSPSGRKRINPKDVAFSPAMGGGGPQASRGGSPIKTSEVPVSRATERTVISPGDQAVRRSAEEANMKATAGLTDVEAGQAQQIAGARHEYSAGLDTFEASQHAKEEARHAELEARFNRADQLSREAASDPIDSKRWFSSKSAGEKFIGIIGVGLGAMGQALTKAPNVAADMMNKAITEDIDAQKANKADKREGARQQMGLFQQYREILGDDRAAAAATRKDMLEAAARHIEDVVADTSSDKIKAQGQKAIAELYQHYADANAQLNSYKESSHFKTVTTGGPAAQPFVKNDGTFLDMPGGYSIKTANPEQAGRVYEQVNAMKEIKRVSAELRAELAKGPSATNTSKVKMLVNNIATSMGAANMGSARMTGQGELENLTHIFDQNGSVTSDLMGRTRGALDAVDASIDSRHRDLRNSFPVYTRAQPTQTGDLVRIPLPEQPQQTEVHARPVE